MKRLIVAFTVLVLAFAGGTANCIVVKNRTQDIISAAEKCIKAEGNNRDEKKELIKIWEKSKKVLSVYVNHKNLSILKSYITQVENSVDKGNIDTEIFYDIIDESEDICYNEMPFFENVF